MFPKRKSVSISMGALVLAAAFALAPAVSASATTTDTSGSNTNAGTVKYWNTARTDTNAKNTDAWRLNTAPQGIAGGWFVAAMRTSGGTTYARVKDGALTNTGVWATIVPDNGNYYNPPRTFYINTEIDGGCGGNGCGTMTWTATLSYNNRVQ